MDDGDTEEMTNTLSWPGPLEEGVAYARSVREMKRVGEELNPSGLRLERANSRPKNEQRDGWKLIFIVASLIWMVVVIIAYTQALWTFIFGR